jgi:hypothetical protein
MRVSMVRDGTRLAELDVVSDHFLSAAPPTAAVLLILLIQAGQPGRQPLDRSLELRIQVDERA